jgi:hypothetical protein
MQLMPTTVTLRAVCAGLAVAAVAACSDDALTATGPDAAPEAAALNGGPSDTSVTPPTGEWHLATIRGVVIGVERSSGLVDTSDAATTRIAGATIEIHKIDLAGTAGMAGDTTTYQLKDLGVVATVETDAQGRFEYVLSDPIIVKSGEPSPLTTYHLTITPRAGSKFAARSGVQVFFAEQLGGGGASYNYFLFPPR